MIRWFLRFAEWLDKRWPPKVVVTQADYDALKDAYYRQRQAIESLRSEYAATKVDLEGLTKSVAAIKDAMSRGNVGASEARKLRADFIAGRLPREVMQARDAIEKQEAAQ